MVMKVKKAAAPDAGPSSDKVTKGPGGEVYITGASKFDSYGGNLFAADPTLQRPGDGVAGNALEWEDDFKGVYGIGKLLSGAAIIEPPYNLVQLEALADRNNALRPCIDAMITNVDGSGWVIEPEDKSSERDEETGEFKDPQVKTLVDFFREPWPGMSFTTIRKKLRRDLERTGNGYLEIVRNVGGDIVFVRHIESKTMRMIALDTGFYVRKRVTRNGVEAEVLVHMRYRRYVQKINTTYMYFKQFGAEREVNRSTGNWGPENNVSTVLDSGVVQAAIDPKDRGTEILHFMVDKDVNTPYGVPRWISQIPSILGSRKAEEYNLSYFDAGGVPPVLITVSGGSLAEKARDAIDAYMSANPKTKNRACVIEVMGGAGGSITDSQKVDIKVEKFGDVQAKDSMFEKYDENCERRVRKAFRLPPLFVGMASDYTYASAYASYLVAEAQVFKPEREEFDELITLNLCRALVGEGFKFRSLPMTVVDVAAQYAALVQAKTFGAITAGEFVKALNEMLSLNVKVDPNADLQAEAKHEVALAGAAAAVAGAKFAEANPGGPPQEAGGPPGAPAKKPEAGETKTKVRKSDRYVEALAEDVHELVKAQDFGLAYRRAMAEVGDMTEGEVQLFRAITTQLYLGDEMAAPDVSRQLTAASMRLLSQEPTAEGV